MQDHQFTSSFTTQIHIASHHNAQDVKNQNLSLKQDKSIWNDFPTQFRY